MSFLDSVFPTPGFCIVDSGFSCLDSRSIEIPGRKSFWILDPLKRLDSGFHHPDSKAKNNLDSGLPPYIGRENLCPYFKSSVLINSYACFDEKKGGNLYLSKMSQEHIILIFILNYSTQVLELCTEFCQAFYLRV